MSDIEISPKFKVELVKFFEWIEHKNYTVKKNVHKDSDGSAGKSIQLEDQEWTLSLFPDFKEPSRNKLIVFIDGILENYYIFLDDIRIIDAKQLVNHFKLSLSLSKSKKSDSSSKKSNKSSKLDDRNPKIILNQKLDTSCNGMLLELEQSTSQLEKVFGHKAPYTGTSQTEHRYEWKFSLNGDIYSVYDWPYYDNTYDEYNDNEWFLGGDNDSKENIKIIKKFLSKKVKPKKQTEETLLNIKSDEFVVDSDDEIDQVKKKICVEL
jgi:hypothetical protein